MLIISIIFETLTVFITSFNVTVDGESYQNASCKKKTDKAVIHTKIGVYLKAILLYLGNAI